MGIETFTNELRELLEKHNVSIGVDIDGDTHGLSYNFVVEEYSNRKETVICEHNNYIDASDF